MLTEVIVFDVAFTADSKEIVPSISETPTLCPPVTLEYRGSDNNVGTNSMPPSSCTGVIMLCRTW